MTLTLRGERDGKLRAAPSPGRLINCSKNRHELTTASAGMDDGPPGTGPGGPLAARLLAAVDAGLVATTCAAPMVFGGRHDLGRLVFVSLVGLTAIAWFARQSLLPKAAWTRSALPVVAAGRRPGRAAARAAAGRLAGADLPAHAQLLPMWTGGDPATQLGHWNTISLTPRETKLALAMLVSYGLLFTVLAQRLQTTADVEQLLNVVGIAALVMAAFGLAQFFTSNGKFFWCYVHPYRTTDDAAMGSFMNRNHFASFLVLGVAPLVRWLVSVIRAVGRRRTAPTAADDCEAVAAGVVACRLGGRAVGYPALLLARRRLALATATVTVGVIYWRWRLVDGKYLYGLAGVGLLMLGALSIYGYDELSNRLDDFASGSLDQLDRGEGRRQVWSANVLAIQQGGLVGSGAGSHREICPVYLSAPTDKQFTHAENGYLQVTTENGVLGAMLLVVGIGLVGGWCWSCWRGLEDPSQQLCFGAAAAGLAASLVHSLVDFVWYIPACMSVTLLLAVCVLRLAQFSLPKERLAATALAIARPTWFEFTAATTVLAGWTIYAFVGPGIAATYWDGYLREAVAGARLLDAEFLPQAGELSPSEASMREPLAESMQHHLEQTLRWDPSFARAHLRLAARDVQRFTLAQQDSENVMTPQQIRDAAEASKFSRPEDLRAWLLRAFGTNVHWLYDAAAHARRAVELSPLEGDGYIFLAELGFLNGQSPQTATACIVQAQRVRPYDGDVAFEVGKQDLVNGDFDAAMRQWAGSFQIPGDHQLRIVGLLAGRKSGCVPASVLIENLHPDWRTLRAVWNCYRQNGQPQDLNDLITYAAQVTERDVHTPGGIPPAYLWFFQASMYSDLEQHAQALECLEKADQCDQQVYAIRYRLGFELQHAGRYSEADPHLRWCRARHPDDKALSAALIANSKQRLALCEATETFNEAGANQRERAERTSAPRCGTTFLHD